MLQWMAQWRGEPTEIAWRESRNRPVAVIDIGSNSVRLVVYEGEVRTPLALFNEKSTCALGKGMQSSGVLNPEGVTLALNAVARFARLAEVMNVARLDVLATAAVRDANDGPAFIEALERRTGLTVKVCSGQEEAELSALGVLCSVPEAEGLVADLGGGSLELVTVSEGKHKEYVTLPLGVLRLAEVANGDPVRAQKIVDQFIGGISWLERARGKSLYAVGGSWRTVARVIIAQRNYPLHVLDNYTIAANEAIQLLEVISHLGPRTLERIPNISQRRLESLPYAAAVLERLLITARPKNLVFSVYGMREGTFFRHLPDDVKARDPLICAAEHMAHAAGRFPEHAGELMDWMDPLFPNETPLRRRLRLACCLMGDAFWNEHPDYQAEQAFLEIMRLPFMGLEHRDRAGLALAVYYRYSNDKSWEVAERAHSLLSEDRQKVVETIGLALRLAHTMSGGAPSVLPRTRLDVDGGKLILSIPKSDPIFDPASYLRRFEKLAANVGLTPVVKGLESKGR